MGSPSHPSKASRLSLVSCRHRDSSHLEQLLRSCARPRRLVVTDTLFSMDGELRPVREASSTFYVPVPDVQPLGNTLLAASD